MYFSLAEPEQDYVYSEVACIKNKADILLLVKSFSCMQVDANQNCMIVKFDHQCLQQVHNIATQLWRKVKTKSGMKSVSFEAVY